MQDVFILPLVLATTRVFPDALGVGSSRSQMIISLFPSIFVSIAMCITSAYIGAPFLYLLDLASEVLFKRHSFVHAQA